MAVQWSGLAPELLLSIDRDGTVGLRSQLEDQLRRAIRSGRLASGERLPSSRQLAAIWGCLGAWSRTATNSCRPRAT